LDVPENIPDNADAQSDEEMKSDNEMSDADSADKDGSEGSDDSEEVDSQFEDQGNDKSMSADSDEDH
jgi:hypothetical protein